MIRKVNKFKKFLVTLGVQTRQQKHRD